MKYPESLSPRELKKLLQRRDWVKLHRSWLLSKTKDLERLSSDWNNDIDTMFEKCILPILSDRERKVLRDKLSMWWRLGFQKTLWVHQSRSIAYRETELDIVKWKKEMEDHKRWPGPQEIEIVESMTQEELERWRKANLTVQALSSKRIGLDSLHISEHFYAFESFAKALCTASCIRFCCRVIDPNSIIQHQEVWKSLKRLGTSRNKDNICRICRFSEDCTVKKEGELFSQSYVALIHMRMLKDYMEDLWFNREIQEYVRGPFFDLSQDLLFFLEDYESMTTGKFLIRPLSLREEISFLKDQLGLD